MRRFVLVLLGCFAVVGTAVAGFSVAGVMTPQKAAVTTNVTVTAIDELFTLSQDNAPVGTVVFTITNNGDEQHDFAIAGQTTPLISHGQTVTLTVNFTVAKDYPYLCNVGEHAIHGMQGLFHVTGTSVTTTSTTTKATTTTTTPPPPTTNVAVAAKEFHFTLKGTTNKVVKTYKNVKVKYRLKKNGKYVKVNGKYVWRTKTVRKLVKTTTIQSVPAGVVHFTVTNTGSIPHNFVIGGEQTLVLAAGKSQTLDVTFTAGKYTYICSIVGHAAAGMKGTLVVNPPV
jgi:uncharacterized cupredoxin-like copper-binding protein